MSALRKILYPVLFLIFVLLTQSIFVVKETERAVKLRFGEIVEYDVEPGLHFKVPVVNTVRKFDARILTLDAAPQSYLTSEKKALTVMIANHMKKAYLTWNKDSVEDEKIINNSLELIYQENYNIHQIESIGPKIGNELRANARNAFLAALLLIGLYITIRFDGFYALGSLAALLHDLMITLNQLLILVF